MILKNSQWLQLSVQKYLMFNAWGEGYLCLLKRFLFLTIRRLYSFSFYVKYIYKKGYKNFLAAFFGALILFKQYQNIYTLTKKWSSNICIYIFILYIYILYIYIYIYVYIYTHCHELELVALCLHTHSANW